MIFNICLEYYELICNNAKLKYVCGFTSELNIISEVLLVKVQMKPIEKVEGAATTASCDSTHIIFLKSTDLK